MEAFMGSDNVALVSIAIAILSALFSYWGQHRIALLAARLKHEESAAERKEHRDRLLAKYRDPLLDAAYDLQSRVYNILEQGFFEKFVIGKTGRDHDYGINHTTFLIAQYFGWVELIRKELRFLDFGDDDRTRRLATIQNDIREAWATQRDYGCACRLFAGVQRAIGERMLQATPQGWDCLGYADFLDCLGGNSVSAFIELRDVVSELEHCLDKARIRLKRVQHLLMDLIDFHDPKFTRYQTANRRKVT